MVDILLAAGAVRVARPYYPLEYRPGGRPSENPPDIVKVRYIANEGFMIEGADTKILIDALHKNPWAYLNTGDRIYSMILEQEEPFDGIDLCVASHAHADHMIAAMHVEHLEKCGQMLFVSSPTARDSIEMIAGDDFASIKSRVIAVDPEWGEFEEREIKGVQLAFFGIDHAGSVEEPFKTLATFVDIGGVSFAHLADQVAGTSEKFYKEVDLKGREVDIVFADRFFLADSVGRHIMAEYIDPQYIVLMHLRPDEVRPAMEELSPMFPNLVVFYDQLEKKIFDVKEVRQ
jgi:L-ascorbate metabolism protein UlaG (beta-lactamase superfamily)